jgi:hypothetical protein
MDAVLRSRGEVAILWHWLVQTQYSAYQRVASAAVHLPGSASLLLMPCIILVPGHAAAVAIAQRFA